MKSLYPILNNVYVNLKLAFTLNFRVKHTVQRFSGPNIGISLFITLGNLQY